jgi:transcriptional regulator with XRE-family HTH domain
MPRSARGNHALAQEFGDRVRARRERLGFTQEGLAEAAGVHRTYIGHLERGESSPTLYNLVRIAEALEIDPGRLVAKMRLPTAR